VTKPPRRASPPNAEASHASRGKTRTTPAIPPEVRALLGPPPITSEEDGEGYARLEVGLAAAIQPTDAIEWIWLKDLADLVWEARRLRRAKVAILAVGRARSARQQNDRKSAISLLSDEELNGQLAQHALAVLDDAGITLPPDARSAILAFEMADEVSDETEAEAELEQLTIESDAYQQCLPDLERVDRMITVADVRRDTVLRDLYRRREMLARQRGPSASAQVIDAEFEA
jgi:hypothetical protein